jgi:hypothetical protein
VYLETPPGSGKALPQLLAYIVDDDDRTRRAKDLLRYLTALLLTVGAVVITVVLLTNSVNGLYTGAGFGTIVAVLRHKRTRA